MRHSCICCSFALGCFFFFFLLFILNSIIRKTLRLLYSNCQSELFDSNLILCYWALERLTYFTTNCWCISCIHLLLRSLGLPSSLFSSALLHFSPAEHQQFLFTHCPPIPNTTSAFIIWTSMDKPSAGLLVVLKHNRVKVEHTFLTSWPSRNCPTSAQS